MDTVLGLHLEPKDLGVGQVCLRSVIVFIVALIMVRVADRRFLGKMAAFDVILGFMLASMLARAINGSAPFFPTLVAGFVLVFLHRALATISFCSDRFGKLVKGEANVLVENGKPLPEAMRAHKITQEDLLEEIRLNGKIASVEQAQTALLERNGTISVVPAKEK